MKKNNTSAKEVIIATGTLGGGGAERVFLNIANNMAQQGICVRILVTGSRPAQSYPLDDNITVDKIKSVKTNKFLKIIDKFFQFRRYFKTHEGCTVISFFPDVSAYCTLAGVGLKVCNVVSERNDPNTIPRKKYMKVIRNTAFRIADKCVFQTEEAKSYFPCCVQKKGTIIPNPLVASKLPKPKKVSERSKIIILAGRIVPQKNFKMMLEAWNVLKNEFPDYEVHIYGDTTYQNGIFAEELEKYIQENGLKDMVKLKGFCTDIYEKMNDASIYVSTSDFEGMSNTMLEAMAIGTPTIATDCPIGGAKAIIEDGKNGILIGVGDLQGLISALRKLLKDSAMRERLSQEGIKLRKKLDVGSVCQMWCKLL